MRLSGEKSKTKSHFLKYVETVGFIFLSGTEEALIIACFKLRNTKALTQAVPYYIQAAFVLFGEWWGCQYYSPESVLFL